jgi:DegV family protein with EDD domain
MGVTIMTDTTSDMSPAQAKEFGIEVVPLWIVFGTERLRDGVDIQRTVFYTRLAAAKELPHTEPADESTFAASFGAAVNAGNDVVATVISSHLSETYKNAVAAASKFGSKVRVVDSQTFSGGLFIQALIAKDLAKAGASAGDIVHALEQSRTGQHGYFISPDLTYLGRSGRLNKAIVALGSVLKVNPVLRIQNGIVDTAAQTRTYEKAQELLIDIATRNIGDISKMRFLVGHAKAPALGAQITETLKTRLSVAPKQLIEYEAGPAVAVNGGPGSIAIFSATG